MQYIAVIILGYLLGSMNAAYWAANFKKVDLLSAGSRNPGTSNAFYVLGWKLGLSVGIFDIGKGIAAVLLIGLLFPALPLAGAVAGTAAVLGHIFPVWWKFRGGKGFATYIGITLALDWKLGLVILALIVIVTLITDYLVMGTLTTVLSVPLWKGIVSGQVIAALILGIATVVILIQHRDNYIRIRNGTELRFLRAFKKGCQ